LAIPGVRFTMSGFFKEGSVSAGAVVEDAPY